MNSNCFISVVPFMLFTDEMITCSKSGELERGFDIAERA